MDQKFNGIVWTGSHLLDVQAPDPAHIEISDIARGLARKYRFGGHTRDDLPAYSIAWHSLFCEALADKMGLPVWVRLQALFHDAPEYVLADFVTPLKVLFPEYSGLEAKVWAAVARRIAVPVTFHKAVHMVDQIALQVEAANLVGPEGCAKMEIPAPPPGFADMGAKWVRFTQSRAQESTLSAALFTARAHALLAVTGEAART